MSHPRMSHTRSRRVLSAPLAAALFVATAATATVVPTPAEAQRLGPYEVLRSGANSGQFCATYRGRQNVTQPTFPKNITRTACFPRLAQCQNWLYWAQSYWSAIYLRRGCS